MEKIKIYITLLLIFILSGCEVSQTSTSTPRQNIMNESTSISVRVSPTQMTSNNITTIAESNQRSIIMFGEGYGEGFEYQRIDKIGPIKYQNQDHYFDFIDRNLKGKNLLGLSLKGYENTNECLTASNWVYKFKEQRNEKAPWIFPPLLSPDNQKVAYLQGSGQLYEGMLTSSYEFQDLIIKNLENDQEEIQLTKNGGARQITSNRYADLLNVWSPDSKWIVFSDLDNNRIYQLYVSRFDGKDIQQITDRSVEGEGPFDFNYSVVWAPSSSYFAVSYFDRDQNMKIISLGNESDKKVIENSYPLWWTDGNRLIVKDNVEHNIKIYDPTNNQSSKLIDELAFPFSMVEPFGDRNKIGFFSYQTNNPLDSKFYVFDIQSMSLELEPTIKLPSERIQYWFLIQDIKGMGDCGTK